MPNRRLRPPPSAFLVTFWASKKSLAPQGETPAIDKSPQNQKGGITMAVKPRLSALFLTAALAAALCACAPKEEAPQIPEEPSVSVLDPQP